ncbi:MAG: hypothetical protein HYS61_04635 [Acidobacteria bacterium]|nr:hypothetical protein [Acidobacteriota bacterium]
MRLRFWRGILFFGIIFLCSIPALGETPLIRMLQIAGTRRPLELLTRAGEPFDPPRVERDVRRLWATGWFEDISVESAESGDGIQLAFKLVERPRVYLRKISFDPPGERRPVTLEQGARVDAVVAARVADELRRQLVEEGYAKAQVEAELVPAGIQQADLRLRVEPGPDYQVREVRFDGQLGLKPKELHRALRATRSRSIIPSLGPLWGGWRLLAVFNEQRLQADLERLRSLYFSRGYFDARVEVGRVDVAKGKATVTIEVDSGRRYRVGEVMVVGAQRAQEISMERRRELPTERLCECLFEERQASEKRGELGFGARLRLSNFSKLARATEQGKQEALYLPREPAEPWVTLKAEIETGPVFRVGRIEFQGHHKVSDSTYRRAMVLREGELLDRGKLRRSLARLNALGLAQPLAEADVEMELARQPNRANLTIPLKENPRGRWSFSGPLGPVSVFGPLAFTIASRLPGVGRGPLELSTYRAEFSLLAWPQFVTLWPLAQQTRWLPLFFLERPYLPGQEWQSGFVLAPQWGWKGTAAHYAYSHLLIGARKSLDRNSTRGPGFSVPASWSTRASDDGLIPPNAGLLRCEPRRSTWAWLRDAGFSAADLAGKWLLTASLL